MLVNPHRGETTLEIGGKIRKLTVDFNTLAQIERGTGISFLIDPEDEKALKHIEEGMKTVDFIRTAIAACLSDRQKTISPELVGRWFSTDVSVIGHALVAFQSALNLFFSGIKKDSDASHPTKEIEERKPSISDGTI